MSGVSILAAPRRRPPSELEASGIPTALDGSTDKQFGDTESLNAVERMLEELRRADCVVQAVDIAVLRGRGPRRVRPRGRRCS